MFILLYAAVKQFNPEVNIRMKAEKSQMLFTTCKTKAQLFLLSDLP